MAEYVSLAERATPITFSMYPSDLAALEQIGKRENMTGRSDIVRWLIENYTAAASVPQNDENSAANLHKSNGEDGE